MSTRRKRAIPYHRALPALGARKTKEGRHVPWFEAASYPLWRMKSRVRCRFPGYESIAAAATSEARRRMWVPKEKWAEATRPAIDAGTVKAMADANRIAPGCVFFDPITAGHLAYLSIAAVNGGSRKARKYLAAICLPRQAKGQRARLGYLNLEVFPSLYRDVVLVRRVYIHLWNKFHDGRKGTLGRLKEVFPALEHLDPRYVNLACGYSRRKGREDDVNPMVAAAMIFGLACNYEERTVRNAVKPFRRRLDGMRALGRQWAAMVIAEIEAAGKKKRTARA